MNQYDDVFINRLKSWLYHQRIRDPDYYNKIDHYINKYKVYYNEKIKKEINKKIKERNDFITL